MARRKITRAAIETDDFIYVPRKTPPIRTHTVHSYLLEDPNFKRDIMKEVTEARGALRINIVKRPRPSKETVNQWAADMFNYNKNPALDDEEG